MVDGGLVTSVALIGNNHNNNAASGPVSWNMFPVSFHYSIGGMAQWLRRQSLAAGLSPTCARCMVDR